MTPAEIAAAVPPAVLEVMDRLQADGYAAYLVGGSLRDLLIDREPHDWDLTTDARPPETQAVFEAAVYENAFGTVVVRGRDGFEIEITTFRSEHEYADFRRPHRVEFGDRVEDDLARRDFTVNALAWGGPASDDAARSAGASAAIVDPFDGLGDLERRTLRTVGDPQTRFNEDALRMLRAIRLSATLGFTIEPSTRLAIAESAHLAAHLSGERIAAEVDRLLMADQPSVGLRALADTGLLAVVAPELAAEIGIAQNKIPGEDLWDHTVRAVDAAVAAGRTAPVRLATLLHDVGKPPTAADGHFYGHDVVGAEIAAEMLGRWHLPRERIEGVVRLIRQHMFAYDDAWSDAAVRRFIAKVGPAALDDLFALREADNVGSGVPVAAGALPGLRARVAAELAANVALDRSGLAVDGNDLIGELGWKPGPKLGRVLDELVERVVADPRVNQRATLLSIARTLAEDA